MDRKDEVDDTPNAEAPPTSTYPAAPAAAAASDDALAAVGPAARRDAPDSCEALLKDGAIRGRYHVSADTGMPRPINCSADELAEEGMNAQRLGSSTTSSPDCAYADKREPLVALTFTALNGNDDAAGDCPLLNATAGAPEVDVDASSVALTVLLVAFAGSRVAATKLDRPPTDQLDALPVASAKARCNFATSNELVFSSRGPKCRNIFLLPTCTLMASLIPPTSAAMGRIGAGVVLGVGVEVGDGVILAEAPTLLVEVEVGEAVAVLVAVADELAVAIAVAELVADVVDERDGKEETVAEVDDEAAAVLEGVVVGVGGTATNEALALLVGDGLAETLVEADEVGRTPVGEAVPDAVTLIVAVPLEVDGGDAVPEAVAEGVAVGATTHCTAYLHSHTTWNVGNVHKAFDVSSISEGGTPSTVPLLMDVVSIVMLTAIRSTPTSSGCAHIELLTTIDTVTGWISYACQRNEGLDTRSMPPGGSACDG